MSPVPSPGAMPGAPAGAPPDPLARVADGRLRAAPGEPAPALALRTGLLVVVAVVLVGWALKAAALVLVPLVAAVMIALAVMPVRDRVRRAVGPRLGWLGVVAAMGVVLLVLAVFFGGLFLAGRQLVAQVPEAASQVVEMLGRGGEGEGSVAEGAQEGASRELADEEAPEGGAAGGAAGGAEAGPTAAGASGIEALADPRAALRAASDQLLGAAGGAAGAVMNAGLAILGGLVLIVFLTLLILLESGQWAEKAARVAGLRAEWQLLESADVVAAKFRAYVLLQAAFGTTTGLLYAGWLWFWGVELILVWSLLSFLMNFVPNVGSVIAGVTTTAYALATKDWGTGVAVGAGILTIEQVMGNVVAPQLQGRNIALSPLVVLVALVFWGWAWGVAGALLAVPVTFALVVLGAHVPALRPWALLLSDRTSMAGLDEVTTR